MTTEEARVIWLTMLGSGWVGQDVIMDAPYKSPLDEAANILDNDDMLEFSHPHYTVRLRCKS